MGWLANLIAAFNRPVPELEPPVEAQSYNRRALLDELTRDEGFRKSAYKDSEGYLTIGIGRLIDAKFKAGITREEAQYLLTNDVKRFEADLDAQLSWWRDLDDVRQRVLLNMCFNLGITKLKKFTRTLATIQSGDYDLASKQMLQSKWARQVGNRALRLSAMMATGQTE